MGGGGSKATTTTSVVSKAAIESIVKNIMNCQNNTTMIQEFIVRGDFTTVSRSKMVQSVNLSSQCANDAQNIADLQQSVANSLKQAAESQSVSVLGALGSSRSEVNANIENEVKQSITNETVTNMINNVMLEQRLIIEGDNTIINEFTMEQTSDLVYNAAQKVVNDLKSTQVLDNNIDQGAKATQTNFIADIFESVFSIFTGPIGVLLMLAVGGVVFIVLLPKLSAIMGENKAVEKATREGSGNVARRNPGRVREGYTTIGNRPYRKEDYY